MDSSAETLQLQPGTLIAGKYQVERVLGAGGMGVVVAALHIDLERRVAIKLMLPEVAVHADAAARFMREGKAACRLKSEHVAKVLDVGRLEDGVPYMVMELLEGSDLSDIVQARGALPVAEAVDYVLQTCEAVAEAHTMGIVHRDLKPANLFVARDAHGAPCVKVLDFGISKVRSADGSAERGGVGAITSTQTVMGSPLYMSPEQMKSARQVDGRADVWGLGCILYELLTGQTLWNACDSLAEVCAAVLTAPAPQVRALAPHVPEGLEAAILLCLQKDLNNRMPSARALVEAIAPYASQLGRVSAERVLGSASDPSAFAGTMSPRGPMGSAAGAITGPGMPTNTGVGVGMMTGPGMPANTGVGVGMMTGPGMTAAPGMSTNMVPGASTNAAWGQTGPGIPASKPKYGLIAGAAAGLLVLVGGGIFVAMRVLAPSTPVVTASVPTAAQSAAAAGNPSVAAAPAACAAPVESPAPTAAASQSSEPEKADAPKRADTVPAKQPVTTPKAPVKDSKGAPAATRTDYGGRE